LPLESLHSFGKFRSFHLAFDLLAKDTPIGRSVAFVLLLASGKADALSACYLDVDTDLDPLIRQAEMMQREHLRVPRLRLAG